VAAVLAVAMLAGVRVAADQDGMVELVMTVVSIASIGFGAGATRPIGASGAGEATPGLVAG